MKLFIYTPNIPYPLNSGGNVSQFAILSSLQKFIEITLCLLISQPDDEVRVEELKKMLPEVRILVINSISKKAVKKLGVKDQIRKFLVGNNNVAKLSSDELMNPHRIAPVISKNEKFIKQFSNHVNAETYDIFQLEFFESLDLIHLLPTNKPSVFIHHEIKFQRVFRAAELSSLNSFYKGYVIELIRNVEVSQLSLYSNVVAFSEIDKQVLNSEGVSNATVIPFPVMKESIKDTAYITSLDKLVFIGPEEHYPNFEGISWFIKECFPLIYKTHSIPLYIVGSWSIQARKQFEAVEGLVFTGYVENLEPIISNAISISPIRIGSGIRTKILYAMAAGMPVISTSVGIEGINVMDREHYLVAEEASDFLIAIEALLTSLDFTNKLASNALDFIKSNYHPDLVVQKRLSLYNNLINSICSN